MADICLVSVPYFCMQRPSVALGLLKSGLVRDGLSTTVVYSNLDFARVIGPELYWFISNYCQVDLLGEWIFASEAFPQFHSPHRDDHDYFLLAYSKLKEITNDYELNLYLKGREFAEFFMELRQKASVFIRETAQSILALQPRIIGCSSTFQEHCASLALLRQIHVLAPDVITMMGGANCEDSLGLVTHKNAPWLDYLVVGEADTLLPPLCHKILEYGRNIPPSQLPEGVLAPCHHQQPPETLSRNTTVNNLDALPFPDYDEYFKTLAKNQLEPYIRPALVMETSRGCWWGQHHQCTFCGLNGTILTYRSKSPQRVVDELEYLSQHYHLNNFLMVDCILDQQYFKTLLPLIKQIPKKYSLVYETKSNLDRHQVEMLAQAGVGCIQPGIESLHDELLKNMNKGNYLHTNIQLLKWTLEYGVNVVWLLLTRLPGDREEWYREMAGWIPLLVHLQPPTIINKVFYARFSQYQKEPGRYCIDLQPSSTYAHVYPFTEEDIQQFAFFYELAQPFPGDVGGTPGFNDAMAAARDWMNLWKMHQLGRTPHLPRLEMQESSTGLKIYDTRPCASRLSFELSGLQADIYRLCDVALTASELSAKLKKMAYAPDNWSEIQEQLDELMNLKLLLKTGSRYLALAVRPPNRAINWDFPGGEINVARIMAEFNRDRYEKKPEPDRWYRDIPLTEIFSAGVMATAE